MRGNQLSKRRSGWRTAYRAVLSASAAGILVTSCVIDSDDPCGDNQVIWGDDERCVCDERSAYTPEGCVRCSDHEMPGPAGCICAAGYARPAGGGRCQEADVCVAAAAPAYCRRPPTGAGMPCTVDADCAGTEATFCDGVVSQTCLVRDCSLSADDCFSGTECCAIAGLPNLCIIEGFCLATP